ncbi:ATP-NAD kinase-like domain-containing protein [Flammula alnicola]|nr:ATP-NAD kinase-like domain-containing protein [Flammula alnicola]
MLHRTITIQTGPISSVKLSLNDTNLSVQKSTTSQPTVHHDIGLRHVLRATFDNDSRTVTVAYLAKKKKELHLVVIEGTVDEPQAVHSGEWADHLDNGDVGLKRSRRLMVFVNPFGGKKKGASIFAKRIEPIFKIAGCSLEVRHTTHQGQAHDIAKTLPLDFDAVITVSGDGLIHEVLNGFAEHADPIKAFATPVAPIPTGSGNGLSLNLLGIEEGFDVVAAALNVIKGKPMKVDLFSVTQGGKRTMSFMSQALGLMADVDIGTDHLRWMGETRFMYGLLRGILTFKPCPVQLSFKVAENDKHKMAEDVHARKQESSNPTPPSPPLTVADESTCHSLPPLRYSQDDEEGWTTFDDPILYVYAGKGPYVARDFMAFPVSLPDDGLIDVVTMTKSSRADVISTINGAQEGASYWHPNMHYVKAHAYRVKPLQKKGYLAVDGEPYPFEEFQVEVHQGLATLLSLYGHYAARFEPRTRPEGTHISHVMEGGKHQH